MAVVFSDNFNRADGAMGSNWTTYFSTWAIASNQAQITSGAANNVLYNGLNLIDGKVSAKHITTANWPGGLVARHAAGTDTFYGWRIYSDGGWEIVRVVSGGVATPFNSGGVNLTLGSGNLMEMQVTGTGATVTIVLRYNGAAVTTISDTAADRITVTGRWGLYGFVNNNLYDDFSLDDLTAGAVFLPQKPRGLGQAVKRATEW